MTFYQRCKESYELVRLYLEDRIPSDHPTFKFDEKVRQSNKQKIHKTVDIFKSCLTKYSLDQLAISYNGGKDCLVMLLILQSTIYEMSMKVPDTCSEDVKRMLTADFLVNHTLDSIYINSETPFPEVSDFISKSTKYYGLNPVNIKSSLKEGFEQYLNLHPSIKTIIVGIRYSDPYGEFLQPEQPTDHHWPKFMRIHPILHWNYVDVWDFIVGCNLDYCILYDKGYTSLGGIENTIPNPYLKNGDSFLPAYMLVDDADERERLGRAK